MTVDHDLESRLPPSDATAERAVLGAMLRDNAVIGDVVRQLRNEHFYHFANQIVFKAIVGLFESRKPSDPVTLLDAVEATGQKADIGGAAYIVELWDSAPAAANATYYAAIIREKAKRRELIQVCNGVLRRALEPAEDIGELIADAERGVFAIGRNRDVSQAVGLAEVVDKSLDRIGERARAGRTVTGIPTGWVDLDAKTAGFQDGELAIIGARPSVGKTAFLVGCLSHLAESGVPALVFSIEQGRLEIGERLLCATGSVSSYRTRTGSITDEDVDKLAQTRHDFLACPGLVNDATEISAADILAEARRCKATHGIRAVFVDYLQLIRSEDRRVPRHEQVATTTRRLKLMARELNVPVIVLAQLNRDIEQGAGRKPRLSDLKESGAIEQDADTVLFIHRAADESNVREIIIAKQRNGPTGEVVLTFKGEYMRFDNFAPDVSDWK